MMGFEPLVNQRLLPPTFPRYAKIIKREDMVAYFSKLIERIKTVCDVINTTNLHGILVNTEGTHTCDYVKENCAHVYCLQCAVCVFARTSSVSSVSSRPVCSPDPYFK